MDRVHQGDNSWEGPYPQIPMANPKDPIQRIQIGKILKARANLSKISLNQLAARQSKTLEEMAIADIEAYEAWLKLTAHDWMTACYSTGKLDALANRNNRSTGRRPMRRGVPDERFRARRPLARLACNNS